MLDATQRPFCPPTTLPTWIRPRHFRIRHVVLNISVDIDQQQIEGTVEHHVTMLPHGGGHRSIELDQHDIAINEVTVDDHPALFSISDGRVIIALPDDINESHRVLLKFKTENPQKGMFFIQADAQRHRVAMAWTQGAMEDHSYWFPAFDNPNNISTYDIAIRHRSPLLALANGDQVEKTDHGDGWTTTRFAQRKPHVLYLVNIAVGDFVAVEDTSGSVPITNFVPRGHEAGCAAMFRATSYAISWLSNYIGVPYVWSRYGHVVVHGFMWGGMENTTLTTITDRGLMNEKIQEAEDVNIDSLVVHELVHQWFGDLLTMKTWSDIWLNESFATYLEARGTAAWRAHQHDGSELDVLHLELWNNKQAYLDEDGGRYRRPLVTNRYTDAYELFDRVAYEKGSLVLHYLCKILGEERFQAALTLYTKRHAHDLVETADWRQAIEDATGEPMDWFFDQWVYRAGHPELKVSWRHDPVRSQLIIELEQKQASSDAQLMYRLISSVSYAVDKDIYHHPVDISETKATLVIPNCKTAPTWVVMDPAGDIPAVWEEAGSGDELIARLNDARLPAHGRARAAGIMAKRHPTAALIAGLTEAISAGQPELVRMEAIAALGALRAEKARDVLATAWHTTLEPRLRRALAKALGEMRHDRIAAQHLEQLIDKEKSDVTIGELLAARGACEYPGATPVLRTWLKKDSWNQRLRSAVLRGLAASGEAAAIDDILNIVRDDAQEEAVIAAAAGAIAQLGARHVLARDRIRVELEQRLEHTSLMVRAATARALSVLGDASARGALSRGLHKEIFGNIARVFREALEKLDKVAAVTTATAELNKRVDELEKAKEHLERRLEALEKRLDK